MKLYIWTCFWILCMVSGLFCFFVFVSSQAKSVFMLISIILIIIIKHPYSKFIFGLDHTYTILIYISVFLLVKKEAQDISKRTKKTNVKTKFFPVFIHFTCDLFDYWDCYPRASSLAYLFSLRKAMHKGSKEKKIVGAPKSTKKHKTKRMISLVTWCDDYSKYDRSHFIG